MPNEIEELLLFLDWIMGLPEEFENRFDAEWQKLEREQAMAQTVAPIIQRMEARGEKRGQEIGELKGKRDTLLQLLQYKFGPPNAEVIEKVNQISDVDRLNQLSVIVLSATRVEDIPLDGD